MSQRRMFSKEIIDSDAFLTMPVSAQNLYFHLGMRADDDGFVNNARSIMALTHATDDDLKILIAKSYVIVFESGVIVIKHWRLNNILRNDRYIPTKYTEEAQQLFIKEDGAYTLNQNKAEKRLATKWQPNDNQMTTQDILGKDILGNNKDILSTNVVDIITFLNQIANSKYKTTTPKTISLIKARLKEGHTVEDFKKVITKKYEEWNTDPKMKNYLRPETLFGNKFESYLNQKEELKAEEWTKEYWK